MKKYLFFIALTLVLASCGRYDKQYSKVISSNETLSIKVDCFTFAGLPFACVQIEKYEKTVELIEFVDRFVDRFIVQKEIEYVKVKEIIREVHAVYSEKDVDINEIAAKVLEILNRDYPGEVVSISDTGLAAVIIEVSEDVVANAPSVVINAETRTVTIESPTALPPPPPSVTQLPPPPPPIVGVQNPKSRVENPSAEEVAKLVQGHWSSHSHNDGLMVGGSDSWNFDAIGNLGSGNNHAHSGGTTGYIVEGGNIRHARSKDRNETPGKVQRLVVHSHNKADWEGNYR